MPKVLGAWRPPSWQLSAAVFAWNICLGLSTLLIPLYAQESGLSAAAIGGLLGVPSLVQLVFLLLGGAYSDRIGGHRVMLLSCVLFALCALSLLYVGGVVALFLGQVLLVVARSVFWPAAWSLNAQAGQDHSSGIGRLNVFINTGQLIGASISGAVAAAFGVQAGLHLMVATAIVGALAVSSLPDQSGKVLNAPVNPDKLPGRYMQLLRLRGIWYANVCSFVSAVPLTLGSSFVPLLLIDRGIGVDAVGVALTLRGVGAILAGIVIARVISRIPIIFASAVVASGTAVCLFALSAVDHPLEAAALMLALGFVAGVMNMYFQLLLPKIGGNEQRGSLMAIGSLGVIASHTCMPLLSGYISHFWGIEQAFAAAALVVFVCAILLPSLHRRAFSA